MIIYNTQSPQKALYLVGANILATVQKHKISESSVQRLHEKYNEAYDSISFSYFMYALDWLFLLGSISMNNNGHIQICS
ncbi:conserved protein of unknown function [Pseudodesulfovibrio profundus]|uniref:Uncharacterized protein n=1 Tax=Pseudodesulfovibrio profundus TaxID=57320 RepID=A0A2C8F6E6_9BACT|nr:conserved protein of unknown function [Pseudodesulfovibrio profundus]